MRKKPEILINLKENNFSELRKFLNEKISVSEISDRSGYDLSTIYKFIHQLEAIDGVDRNEYLPNKRKSRVKSEVKKTDDNQPNAFSEVISNIESLIKTINDDSLWKLTV